MVAAWINAEIGVGPSIDSGNQTCKGTCADFPIAPINNKKQITAIKEYEVCGKILIVAFLSAGAAWKTW